MLDKHQRTVAVAVVGLVGVVQRLQVQQVLVVRVAQLLGRRLGNVAEIERSADDRVDAMSAWQQAHVVVEDAAALDERERDADEAVEPVLHATKARALGIRDLVEDLVLAEREHWHHRAAMLEGHAHEACSRREHVRHERERHTTFAMARGVGTVP